MYRHDAWRSAGTTSAGPQQLATLWRVDLGDMQNVPGPILADWQEDPYIKEAVNIIGDIIRFSK